MLNVLHPRVGNWNSVGFYTLQFVNEDLEPNWKRTKIKMIIVIRFIIKYLLPQTLQ